MIRFVALVAQGSPSREALATYTPRVGPEDTFTALSGNRPASGVIK